VRYKSRNQALEEEAERQVQESEPLDRVAREDEDATEEAAEAAGVQRDQGAAPEPS
jgi:hypothetical protein